jgi:hypothetical protein
MTAPNAKPDDLLSMERFDFSRVGDQWTLVRLLTRLQAELDPKALAALCGGQAQLIIDHGDLRTWSRHPARACRLERRLVAAGRDQRRGGSELLWHASFAIPRAFVEAREAIFELAAGDHLALALPAPQARFATARPLPLVLREYSAAPRITAGQARQRVAALATIAALTATSGSGVALAAGVTGGDASGSVAKGAGNGKSAFALKSASTPSAPAGPTKVPQPSPRPATQAPQPTAKNPTTMTTIATPTTRTTAAAPKTSTTTTTRTTAAAPTTTTTTTTTTTVAAPTTTTTAPARLAAPRPAPRCHSSTRGDLLAVNAAHQTRYGKRAVGLSVDPAPRNCTPTSAPKPGHQRPTATRPRHGSHPRHGAKPGHGTQSRPGAHPPSGPPLAGHRLHERATGGAPLIPLPVRQPNHTLSPTPSTSAPSSGGASVAPVPTLSSSPPGFLAPQAWTGTVTADPSLTGAVRNLSGLLTNGNRPPSFLIPIYMQAGARYDIPWPVLAAINAIESDYGRNLSTSSAGALGWMQFEPSTWRQYGVAADGHSNPNPYDPRDAIFAAARYLKAAGGSQDISKAVFAYNHAGWYVNDVMSRAQAIAHHVQYQRAKRNQRGTFSVFFATGVKWHPTVRYSGGLLSHYDRLIAAANMVSAANFPYLYGGGHEQPARWGPFDCSGSVSYVMQQAGYKVPTTVSGDIPSWNFPAGPGRVTIFYNPVHTFMRIGNRYFGTSGFARPGGGAGWFNVDKLPAGYLSTFRVVHVPGLGANSFAPTKFRHDAPAKPRHTAPAKPWDAAPAKLQHAFPTNRRVKQT